MEITVTGVEDGMNGESLKLEKQAGNYHNGPMGEKVAVNWTMTIVAYAELTFVEYTKCARY